MVEVEVLEVHCVKAEKAGQQQPDDTHSNGTRGRREQDKNAVDQ